MQSIDAHNKDWDGLMNRDLIELISSQNYNDDFSRLDLIVRYAFLEGLEDPSLYPHRKGLYEKMQYSRCGTVEHTSGETFVNEFIKMSESFKQTGFLPEFPLVVNESGHLINSSHRASCCLYYDIRGFPYEVTTDWRTALVNKNTAVKSYFMYGRDWFERNGFTSEELAFVDSKRREVMRKVGHYFVFTLWDPSKKFHRDIVQDLAEKTEILSVNTGTLNETAYRNTVLSVYEIDDISEDRIHKKIENMPHGTELTYVFAHIWNPTFRPKNVNPKVRICTEIEAIKKSIREKYKPLMDNYYYDNIIHAGDNFEHSAHLKRVLENAGYN